MSELQAAISTLGAIGGFVPSVASLERQRQPAHITSRKSPPVQLGGLCFLKAFPPKSLVTSATAVALSSADSVNPSRPVVRTEHSLRDAGTREPAEIQTASRVEATP